MEKAHNYTYKRMKRNPRRRDNGIPAPAQIKRRRNVRAAPVAPSKAPAQLGASLLFPRTQPSQSGTGSLLERDPFAHSFGFAQQPRVSLLDNINLLEPVQIQTINDNLFPEAMVDHPMGMDQPFYVEDYSTGLHGHSDTNPTLVPGDFLPTQSTEYMDFLSDFPDRENSFGAGSQVYQQPIEFQFNPFDFGDSSDCERQGDTPD